MLTVRTLYIRNVPELVATRLEALAASEGVSVNALVVRELTEATGRSFNADVLACLPDLELDIDTIVADIRSARDAR
jgi:plasmid stability protein